MVDFHLGNTEEKDPDRNNDRNGYILFTKSRQNMEIPTAVEQVIKVSKESAKSRQSKEVCSVDIEQVKAESKESGP